MSTTPVAPAPTVVAVVAVVASGGHPPVPLGYGVGAGMRKADAPLKQQMDQALEQLHASGKYAQIAKKYFPIDLWPH